MLWGYLTVKFGHSVRNLMKNCVTLLLVSRSIGLIQSIKVTVLESKYYRQEAH